MARRISRRSLLLKINPTRPKARRCAQTVNQMLEKAYPHLAECARLTSEEIAAIALCLRGVVAAGTSPRIAFSEEAANDLAEQAARDGGDAMDVLIYWAGKIIASSMRRISWFHIGDASPEDAWQQARLLVIRAAKRYDRAKGYNFGAYASVIVANGMSEWAERHACCINAPRSAFRKLRHEGETCQALKNLADGKMLPRYLECLVDFSTLEARGLGIKDKDLLDKSLESRVEDLLACHESHQQLQREFSKLAPVVRRVLHLYVFEHKSAYAISRLLHVGTGTITALIDEGLARLSMTAEGVLEVAS